MFNVSVFHLLNAHSANGTSGIEHRRYQIQAGNAGLQIGDVPI